MVVVIINEQIIRPNCGIDHLPGARHNRHHRFLRLRRHEESSPGSVCQPTVPLGRFRVAIVSCIIGTISMWIMWACTYMHQMNPIIEPILMVKKWSSAHYHAKQYSLFPPPIFYYSFKVVLWLVEVSKYPVCAVIYGSLLMPLINNFK